jgi:dipeptidyl-peptidase III
MEINRSEYEIHDMRPRMLDARDSFNQLTQQEKKYLYWMNQAGHYGSSIIVKQTSPESYNIITFFVTIFNKYKPTDIKESLSKSFDSKDVDLFFNYVAAVFFNYGNYRGFGDTKIIPALPQNRLIDMIGKIGEKMVAKLKLFIDDIYSLTKINKTLGYPLAGITMYYSKNISKDEIAMINRFMVEQKMEGWNTRIVKYVSNKMNVFEIWIASIMAPKDFSHNYVEFESSLITIRHCDYIKEMLHITTALKQALQYAANDNQKKMIEHYILHFKYGNIWEHKKSQQYWLKDKKPTIECNIGFIENYRDPAGIRSEFEAFTAVVNKAKTERLQQLVKRAPEFIQKLPWYPEYEKKNFIEPDFTSLDIISFVASGMPVGINIPNYNDIREGHGSKNVSLGNVLRSSFERKNDKMKHLTPDDEIIYKQFNESAFEVHVAGHELLGHGSGILFGPDGGQTKFYQEGETWESVFGEVASAYEECRAECVGLILCHDKDAMGLFGINENDYDNISYTNWINMIMSAIRGLHTYIQDSKLWKQAHSQARFVIMRVLMDKNENLFTIKIDEENDNFIIGFNKQLLLTEGINIIKEFVKQLQIYKSTADVENGSELFEKYSDVSEYFINLRRIYVKYKKPREQHIQPHLELSFNDVIYAEYEASSIGEIESFVDNWPY